MLDRAQQPAHPALGPAVGRELRAAARQRVPVRLLADVRLDALPRHEHADVVGLQRGDLDRRAPRRAAGDEQARVALREPDRQRGRELRRLRGGVRRRCDGGLARRAAADERRQQAGLRVGDRRKQHGGPGENRERDKDDGSRETHAARS